jgi:large subunit ribosomal protein L30
MSRMLFTVKQTGSPIGCHKRKQVVSILRGLGLRRIGQTADVPYTPQTRGMLRRVKHLIEVIFVQIDIAWLAKQVRDEYREIIVGAGSRIVRGQVLWDQFEAAVVSCLADPKRDDRQLTEKINEIAVAAVLVADRALAGRPIQYEPDMLPDGRRIDFVIDRGADNLYVEVKTVSPRTNDSDKAWEDFLRRKKFHPKTLDYMVTREGMGGMIHGNEFASRGHFFDYTRAFEERLAAAKAIKPGPGVLVFCGTGFAWRKSNLEDFADFYRTGIPRADDPFGKMQQHDIEEKKINLLRNVDHFAFLQRPIELAQKQGFYFSVRGPKFGAFAAERLAQ